MDKRFTIHIVPHTHWDREWYFTLEEFRYRLIKLMDILIDTMERDIIRYFVLDGQTIMLEDYLKVRPQNRQRLRALIESGRLFIGPWYTQPNIFMSGAEAQVRNLLFGRKDMERWGGGMYDINYMPDQFGYTSQLPQMMHGFGMTHLVGARGLPKRCHTYIRWEGVDGSAVHVCALPHSYINACGISDREEQKLFSVFGEPIVMPSLPDRMNIVLSERDRAIAPHLLAMNGVDHMYPNTSMIKTIEKIRELYPDVDVEQSNFSRYISAVEKSLEREPETYRGEQRDGRENFILPASQSTRMDVKKYNRRLEDLLERRVEPLIALMLSLGEENLPLAEYEMAWEYVLQNQAHDSLCCANSEPSYREILTRFEKAEDICREICNELEQRLIRRIKECPQEALLVRNPTPFERDEPITVEVIVSNHRDFPEPHLFFGDTEIPAHILGVRTDTLLRYVPFSGLVGQLDVAIFRMTINPGKLPPMGWKIIEIRGGRPHDRVVDGLVSGPDTLENEYLTVRVEPDATLTVTDKRTGQVYTGLNRFIDSGEAGCGFIHAAPYDDTLAVSGGKNLALEIVENTPLRGAIEVSQDFPVPKGLSESKLGRSEEKIDIGIVTRVILRAGCPYVELETDIYNTAKDHRLRVAFPSDTNTRTGYAGQPFDVIKRPVQPKNVNHLDEGDYEPFVGYHPMNDFCGITDGTRGFAVAGDGIMEYEILPMRNTVSLTLIRATDRLHVGVLGSGSKFKIPAAQLLGKQSYRYAFIPHAGGLETALPEVERFRHPLQTVQKDFLEAESMPDYKPLSEILPREGGFITVRGGVVVTCLKPAEDKDGVILRFYNPSDTARDATISADPAWRIERALETRMDETQGSPVDIQGDQVVVTAGPKKIITLRLHIEKRPVMEKP